jgi:quaternary ammonium compound-resistance protein SugE
MHWLFLILASVCEICWLYCIRYLNFVSAGELLTLQFIHKENSWLIIFALLGYAGFGIANVLLFSMAMKKIPASTAFSTWTGLALCGTTLVDAYFLHLDFTVEQGIFMVLICAGILGLKVTSPSGR